jgi:hypothetical protein
LDTPGRDEDEGPASAPPNEDEEGPAYELVLLCTLNPVFPPLPSVRKLLFTTLIPGDEEDDEEAMGGPVRVLIL